MNPDIKTCHVMLWRARQISFLQRLIESARESVRLGEQEKLRLCLFAAEEIFKLNIISHEDARAQYEIAVQTQDKVENEIEREEELI